MFHPREQTPTRYQGDNGTAQDLTAKDVVLPPVPCEVPVPPGERLRNLDRVRQEVEGETNKQSAAFKLLSALRDAAGSIKSDPHIISRLRNSWSPEYNALLNTSRALVPMASSMSVTQLGRVLESMAVLGFRDENLFHSFGREVLCHHKRKLDVRGPDMGRIMGAFAHLDIQDSGLIRNFVKIVQSIDRHKYLDISDRARIGWSLILLGPSHIDRVLSPSFLTDFDRTSSMLSWGEMYQALLVGGKITQYEPFPRRKALWEHAQESYTNQFESRVQQGIENHLRHIAHVLEPHQNVAGVHTDFVLYLEDRTIAIECDGYQYHYSIGPDGDRRLGLDSIQERILKACGLEVVHISSLEWRGSGANQLLSSKLGILS